MYLIDNGQRTVVVVTGAPEIHPFVQLFRRGFIPFGQGNGAARIITTLQIIQELLPVFGLYQVSLYLKFSVVYTIAHDKKIIEIVQDLKCCSSGKIIFFKYTRHGNKAGTAPELPDIQAAHYIHRRKPAG